MSHYGVVEFEVFDYVLFEEEFLKLESNLKEDEKRNGLIVKDGVDVKGDSKIALKKRRSSSVDKLVTFLSNN